MKDQTDRIILESLNYSKRMLASTMSIILFIIGIAFIVSPLFLASQTGQGYIWILGLAIVAIAILYTYVRKKGCSMKVTNKACYLVATMLQSIALILEILPIGVVMVFATGPTERTTELYSYFSLLPLGYANLTPMLTGILTIAIILLEVITLFRYDKASKCRNVAFVCSILSLLFSIVPLFLFGTTSMTVASYAVSGTIFLSICLQAVANRKEYR